MRRPASLPRVLFSLSRILLASYVGLGALAWLLGDRISFRPPPPSRIEQGGVALVEAADGVRLATLVIREPAARLAILFHHGNAEDLGDVGPFLAALSSRLHVSVVGYDYRGYGTSEGRPGEAAAYADAEVMHRHAQESLGIPPGRIVLHGRSLGGAVAADLATRRPAAGLILESTFVSAARLVMPVRLFPFDLLPVGSKIARVSCPTLLIHGSRDEVAPPWHAEANHRASAGRPRELVIIEGAGHDDVAEVGGERYFEAIGRFLESLP